MPKQETILLSNSDEVRFFSAAKPGQDIVATSPMAPWAIVAIEWPYVTLEALPTSVRCQTFQVPRQTHRRLANAVQTHAGILKMDD